MDPATLHIGYVPYSPSLRPPGDRRRFVNWARSRNIPFELAEPGASYDVVVLSARADISRWARHPRGRGRIVYDLIDSYLTVPAWTPGDVARGLGKTLLRDHARLTPSYTRAVITMCRRADVVICSTPEQRADILRFCPDVRVILDVHDDEILSAPRPAPEPDRLRLFWEGLPQNLSGFRPTLLDALRALSTEMRLSLHVVTDLTYPRWLGRVGVAQTSELLRDLPVDVTLHSWESSSLPSVAAQCDVGVIPLDVRDRFASGKPENKLLIMWQLGMAAVTSATPAYVRAMRAAGLSDTCASTEDWLRALRRLADPRERRVAAGAGGAYVKDQHTGKEIRRAWDEVIRDVATRGPG